MSRTKIKYRTGDTCPHDGTILVLNGMISRFNQANMTCGTCGYTKPVKIHCSEDAKNSLKVGSKMEES